MLYGSALPWSKTEFVTIKLKTYLTKCTILSIIILLVHIVTVLFKEWISLFLGLLKCKLPVYWVSSKVYTKSEEG